MVTRARAGTRASSISVSLTVTTTLRDTESHFSIVKTVRVHIFSIDINMLDGLRSCRRLVLSTSWHTEKYCITDRQMDKEFLLDPSPPFTQQTFLNNCPPHPMTRKLVT